MILKAKQIDKKQSQSFIDAAREIGAEGDEKAFDDKLRRIAKQQPKTDKPGQ